MPEPNDAPQVFAVVALSASFRLCFLAKTLGKSGDVTSYLVVEVNYNPRDRIFVLKRYDNANGRTLKVLPYLASHCSRDQPYNEHFATLRENPNISRDATHRYLVWSAYSLGGPAAIFNRAAKGSISVPDVVIWRMLRQVLEALAKMLDLGLTHGRLHLLSSIRAFQPPVEAHGLTWPSFVLDDLSDAKHHEAGELSIAARAELEALIENLASFSSHQPEGSLGWEDIMPTTTIRAATQEIKRALCWWDLELKVPAEKRSSPSQKIETLARRIGMRERWVLQERLLEPHEAAAKWNPFLQMTDQMLVEINKTRPIVVKTRAEAVRIAKEAGYPWVAMRFTAESMLRSFGVPHHDG